MQITVKSVKVLKTGTNDYGEWKLVKVITDEDVEYTTLAPDAGQIPVGSVINIINMDEDKEGRKNFKKFEIVTAGTDPPPPSTDMSKDEWAEKDQRKIASIEGQNALTNLTQLTIAGIKLEDCPKLLWEAIECKITGFMGATSTTLPKTEVKPQEKTKVEKDKDELFPKLSESEGFIDMGWLVDSLNTLRGKGQTAWEETNALSYIKTNYKVEAETVLKAASKLGKGQAKHFCNVIQKSLDQV